MHTIGKAAKLAGLSVDTLRFYERAGLLSKPQRSASRYRLYDDQVIARLRFIRRAKSLGFSLQEIQELLFLNDGRGNRKSVRSIGEKRLLEVEQKIDELTRIQQTLSHLVKQCDGFGPLAGCPIIDAMLDNLSGTEHRGPSALRAPTLRKTTRRKSQP